MKKPDTLIREFVRRISDEDLRFLNSRFRQNLEGDRASIANLLSQDKEMDRWLASALSANEWFGMLDLIGPQVSKEWKRRMSMSKERDKRPSGVIAEAS
jgi:hypothetical protein